jgi:hypothetical protein
MDIDVLFIVDGDKKILKNVLQLDLWQPTLPQLDLCLEAL